MHILYFNNDDGENSLSTLVLLVFMEAIISLVADNSKQ